MSISLFSFALLFSLFASSPSTTEPVSFAAGVTAYEKQDYAGAQGVFHQLLSEQPNNPVLLYNLGLAEYQLENWGLALGLWRKARDIDTSYSPPKVALAFAEEKLFPQHQSHSIFRTIYLNLISLPLFFWIPLSFVMLFTLLWLSIDHAVKRKTPLLHWPTWLLSMIPLTILLSLFVTSFYIDQAQLKATIVQKNLKTHAAPSETSPTLTELLEGQVVDVERSAGGWVQIRPTGGSPGWVPQNSIIAFGGI